VAARAAHGRARRGPGRIPHAVLRRTLRVGGAITVRTRRLARSHPRGRAQRPAGALSDGARRRAVRAAGAQLRGQGRDGAAARGVARDGSCSSVSIAWTTPRAFPAA
jgi:hypothetical protein